jgi:GH25 family lysozyme M1 (1,4-beta-N-acetylmuramidase)
MSGRKKKNRKLVLQWLAVLVATVVLGLLFTRLFQPDPVPGIDVSSHQGPIDWKQVADSGVEFAIIRLGYRSYEDGTLHVDPRAAENLSGARAAGLKIGGYFFSQALNEEEAREEAALALEVLDGLSLNFPLAYDWEYVGADKRTGTMEPEVLIDCIHAFCDTIAQAGYESMVYFNLDLSQTLLDLNQIRDYPFWYARYGEKMDLNRRVLLWQYSETGSVPGIEEPVDLNWWYPKP